jgi:hypothetical protein
MSILIFNSLLLTAQIVISQDSVFLNSQWKKDDLKNYSYTATTQRTSKGKVGPESKITSTLQINILTETDTSYEVSWKYSGFTFNSENAKLGQELNSAKIEVPELFFQTTKEGSNPRSLNQPVDSPVATEIKDFYGLYGLIFSTKDTLLFDSEATTFNGWSIPITIKVNPLKINAKTILLTGDSEVNEDRLKEELLRLLNDLSNDEENIKKAMEDFKSITHFEFLFDQEDGSIIHFTAKRAIGSSINNQKVETYNYELLTR